MIVEFSCRGFNTNSFLKFFGGINNGRMRKTSNKPKRLLSLDLFDEFLAPDYVDHTNQVDREVLK